MLGVHYHFSPQKSVSKVQLVSESLSRTSISSSEWQQYDSSNSEPSKKNFIFQFNSDFTMSEKLVERYRSHGLTGCLFFAAQPTLQRGIEE